MVKPIKKVQMGKNGLTVEFMSQVKMFFDTERMIKIVVLKSACRDKDELKVIADKIVNELGNKYKYRIVGYVITVMRFRKDVRSSAVSE